MENFHHSKSHSSTHDTEPAHRFEPNCMIHYTAQPSTIFDAQMAGDHHCSSSDWGIPWQAELPSELPTLHLSTGLNNYYSYYSTFKKGSWLKFAV